ncbi:MAG: hypothetical protein RIC18_09275 [Hoeflea sp.]|uniref:hypothetical protein n=1 Tax=Hoeflea sp. TaxID=1940281 RepID=UPI0032ECE3D6
MTASLARFLPDFELSHIRSFPGIPDEVAPRPQPVRPAVDVEAIRAEARAEGEAAVRNELEARHASELDAAAARHADELAALRTELEAFAAKSIPEAVSARSVEIADAVAGDVAQILAPLIDEAVRARVVAQLAAEIRGMLDIDNAGRITVTGPESLVAALGDSLGADVDRISVIHDEQFDIEIETDRTLLASRLSEWTQALKESLA